MMKDVRVDGEREGSDGFEQTFEGTGLDFHAQAHEFAFRANQDGGRRKRCV